MQCDPHRSQSYAEIHWTEQAEMKCKPMPTGYKVCKESKARVSVWDDRALHPNDGTSECRAVVHSAFKQRSYSPVRVIHWETGLLCVQLWRTLLQQGLSNPLEQ